MSDDPLNVGHQTDEEDLPVEEQPGYQEAYDAADKETE